MTWNPITQNALEYMGTQLIPVPMLIISHTWASRYSFSQVQAQVAQKNPKATHADL